jgi:hypothetical protein
VSKRRRRPAPRPAERGWLYLVLPVGFLALLIGVSLLGRPGGLRPGALAAIDRQTPPIIAAAAGGDLAGALDAAAALVDREDARRVLCHGLYHELGLVAGTLPGDARSLLELGAASADLTNEQCESGYLHGVLIAKLAAGLLADDDLAPLCTWFAGEVGASGLRVCLHGIGHALGADVVAGRRDFAGAGAGCASVEAAAALVAGECAGGLAMEYFERTGATADGDDACLALESPGRERCLDVFVSELVFSRLESFAPADRPGAAEVCADLSGRLAWACRGAVGGSTANAGIARGREFLVERLERACAGDRRCLVVGVAEAALLQGPDVGSYFCRLFDGSLDCATVVGSGLRDAGECSVFGLAERPRCEAASRIGRAGIESFAPPPGEPGSVGD